MWRHGPNEGKAKFLLCANQQETDRMKVITLNWFYPVGFLCADDPP
jgi:hypothetical protein